MINQKKKYNFILLKTVCILFFVLFGLQASGCYEFLLEDFGSDPNAPVTAPLFPEEKDSRSMEEIILQNLENGVAPTIHNDEEFNYLMDYQMKKRSTDFLFHPADGFTIDNDLLLYRFSLPYVSNDCYTADDGSEIYRVYPTYYPGTLIADAYKTGDTSSLSEDELTVYNMAVDFVENEVNVLSGDLVKERAIHDYICASTVYTNPESNDPIPRHCTAVGLLLDGKANCQGYTDCFYMLSDMAGFTVDKQSGSAEGSLHVWNIIKLGDVWYSVDPTYDDTTFNADGSGHPAYIYFNAGKDILLSTHSIPGKNELIPITNTSDSLYFYYSYQFDGAGSNADRENAVEEIAELLENCYGQKNAFVSYYIPGQTLDSSEIVNEIQSHIHDQPRIIYISTFHVGNNTYIQGEPLLNN